MNFFEAIRLALATIRVQKLKSFFTMLGVCIGVTFLITVVSIVNGMGKYMEDELVGKLIALNSFELRNRPNINIGDVSRAQWLEYNRRPRIIEADVAAGGRRAAARRVTGRCTRTTALSVESPYLQAAHGRRHRHRRPVLRDQEARRHRGPALQSGRAHQRLERRHPRPRPRQAPLPHRRSDRPAGEDRRQDATP